jgi:hypothetical protein
MTRFCTQAIIFAAQRPPEWQVFQPAGYDREFALVNKPMMIVDWAAPFSLSAAFEHEPGTIEAEAEATAASTPDHAQRRRHLRHS